MQTVLTFDRDALSQRLPLRYSGGEIGRALIMKIVQITTYYPAAIQQWAGEHAIDQMFSRNPMHFFIGGTKCQPCLQA